MVLRQFDRSEKIQSLAMWVKIKYGTVEVITQGVLTAIHSSRFKRMHIRWFIDQKKKKLKNREKYKHFILSKVVGVWLTVHLYYSIKNLNIIRIHGLIERATIQ